MKIDVLGVKFEVLDSPVRVIQYCPVCGVYLPPVVRELSEWEFVHYYSYLKPGTCDYYIPVDCCVNVDLSMFPRDMRDYDRNLGNTELLEWVVKHKNDSMFLIGASGCGKTRALVEVGISEVKLGKSVIFYQSAELVRMMSSLFKEDVSEANRMFGRIRDCSVLIIDDFGREKLTERGEETLFSIIDSRYSDGSRLWISSNYDIGTVCGRLVNHGKPVERRLTEVCSVWHGKSGKPKFYK